MTNQNPTIAPGRFVDREPVTEQELHALGIDLGPDFPGSTAADFLRRTEMAAGR